MTGSMLIAGAGNIGSHLGPLIERAGVRLLKILDRDVVEAKNLRNQDFRLQDVGRPKAEVLAERLRDMNPGVTVEAVVGDLEQLPLGVFDVDVMFGGLDSRRARQALVSEIAWPLGRPVVDGGVGEGLLGRVQVFVPAETTACLECGWGEADYRRLVEEYPCEPGQTYEAPSTLSPAFCGAVVAGLMAAEGFKLLGGVQGQESREIAFDLNCGRFLTSRLRRGKKCRFHHETVREFLRLPRPFSVATVVDLIETVETRFGTTAQVESRHGFFGGDGFHKERFVTSRRLSQHARELLSAVGLRPGDFLRVRRDGESAFVVLA